jgi:hypothetical protein
MDLRSFLRYLRRYAYRRRIDWTLKNGEVVVSDHWPQPIEIVDINWSLMAAAVRILPDVIVVWPLWSLRRASA